MSPRAPRQFSLQRAPRLGTATIRRGSPCRRSWLLVPVALLIATRLATGQTTGQIYGRVVEAESGRPVDGALVEIRAAGLRTLTTVEGDFILVGAPTGVHELRVERLGFRTVLLQVRVRATRVTQLTVELPIAPVDVEGVAAEVERARLIEPDVTVSHEVLLGRELRQLPVDDVEEAVELAVGVTEGRFRGGRVGQEVYRIDGLELKNQVGGFEAGPVLELPPSALEEIEVVTGGFGADAGSALSGVVSYVSRRGSTERWEGRAALASDGWLGDDLSPGFTGLSLSAGGPLHFLGRNTTVRGDLFAQGKIDADARARGLTCLRPDDGDEELAAAIATLRQDDRTAHLYCPYTQDRLPYQRGDRLIAFLRLDRPVSSRLGLTLTLLHNRRQQELYTPEFKYNPDYQLGRSFVGDLATFAADWSAQHASGGYRIVARGAFARLDRYLGVVDPWTFGGRDRVAGFGFADFRFLGEDAARAPIEEQLADPRPLPGYARPGGHTGSPFGPAAEGIFFTEGTPGLAAWNRSDLIAAEVTGEILSTRGHAVRAGGATRFYAVESYERPEAYLSGSLPNFARFYPTTLDAFAEVSLLAAHDVTIDVGLRAEAFTSGLTVEEEPGDFRTPVIDSEWHTEVMPRIGVAVPIPGTAGRTMFRFNYGRVAEPPDFRFFLDTTIGDSLRADITRQGDPNLSFERGTSWEVAVSHLLSDAVSASATAYYKELHNLVSSSVADFRTLEDQFTTGDFGTVKGIELTVQGRWPAFRFRAGYALQSARGLTSSPFEDPGTDIVERRIEFPLAFDNRHAGDATVLAGEAAGSPSHVWGAALTASARSGFPVDRTVADPSQLLSPDFDRLPWIYTLNLRISRAFTGLPGCGGCRWRLVADGRNVLGRDNVIALRRDTGSLSPSVDDLRSVAAEAAQLTQPIPIESPRYSAGADLDHDGLITAGELETARFAAALDRSDPSLFFGPARELRLGLELEF